MTDQPSPTPERITEQGVYVASRASIPERSAMWRQLRLEGHIINSSWIDEAGEGETGDFTELWGRIFAEIKRSACLILYAEADDFPLKGALVEVGIALGLGKPVRIVANGIKLQSRTFRPLGSWVKHSQVSFYTTVADALHNLPQHFPAPSTGGLEEALTDLFACWDVFYKHLPDGEYQGLAQIRAAVNQHREALRKYEGVRPAQNSGEGSRAIPSKDAEARTAPIGSSSPEQQWCAQCKAVITDRDLAAGKCLSCGLPCTADSKPSGERTGELVSSCPSCGSNHRGYYVTYSGCSLPLSERGRGCLDPWHNAPSAIGEKHDCKTDDRKLPIDRPCSACSAGDPEMKYHNHCPPFKASAIGEKGNG